MNREFQVEPVTAANTAELFEACQVQDGHIVPPSPSHLFRNASGEIVSAIALFSPVTMFWAHTKKVKARESQMHILRCIEMAKARHPDYLLACSAQSPYRPFLEPHFGFRLLGGVDVFDHP